MSGDCTAGRAHGTPWQDDPTEKWLARGGLAWIATSLVLGFVCPLKDAVTWYDKLLCGAVYCIGGGICGLVAFFVVGLVGCGLIILWETAFPKVYREPPLPAPQWDRGLVRRTPRYEPEVEDTRTPEMRDWDAEFAEKERHATRQ